VDILVVMPARNQIDQAVRIDGLTDSPFPLDLIVRTPRTLAWRLAAWSLAGFDNPRRHETSASGTIERKGGPTMRDLEGLPTIHFTAMPDVPADDPHYLECQTFRRELPRLLAQGHEGKWALIKGNEIVGVFETLDEAHIAGLARYPSESFILQPVREWQPVLRMRVGA
jgi:hypothetical protein